MRNGGPWVDSCLSALSSQTRQDFEVILVDDGCTDDSITRALRWTNLHIRIVPGPRKGLGAALATAVEQSRSDILLRQDIDDISLPQRFEMQIEYMETHPKVVALGTAADVIDDFGQVIGSIRNRGSDDALRLDMCIGNPFIATSMALRREAVLRVGNYRLAIADDYDLWVRLQEVGQLRNLGQTLVQYRLLASSLSHSMVEQFASVASELSAVAMAKRLGCPELTTRDRELLSFFHGRSRRTTLGEAMRILSLLARASMLPRDGSKRVWCQPTVALKPVYWTLRSPRRRSPNAE